MLLRCFTAVLILFHACTGDVKHDDVDDDDDEGAHEP